MKSANGFYNGKCYISWNLSSVGEKTYDTPRQKFVLRNQKGSFCRLKPAFLCNGTKLRPVSAFAQIHSFHLNFVAQAFGGRAGVDDEIMTDPNNPQSGKGMDGVLSRPALICLVLAVITLATYWPVTNCEFINFDDQEYVTFNQHVQGGLTWSGLAWAFTTGWTSNWHPLTWVSHMLDAELLAGMSGNEAAGPHLVNLLFHVANTVLLFLVLLELTGARWRSALVAALFALHPLHVESVAWVSERKDVLSTFFMMLTLRAYVRHVAGDKWQVTRTDPALSRFPFPVSRFYWLALMFFALGLMSKPMLVTLPFVLLLLDYWPLGRVTSDRWQVTGTGERMAGVWSLVVEKIPFFVLSAAMCVVTVWVQKYSGAVRSLTTIPMGLRFENAAVSVARYLGKMFWPSDLVILYPYPGHWPLGLVIFALALVAGVSLATLWFGRRQPYLVTGWFWFLGMLVPVIGLVQVGQQAMADRYTYVPLVGMFIALTWGLTALLERWRMPRGVMVLAAFLALGACAVRTVFQIGYWQNSGTLFRHALALTENNHLAHDNLGIYLFDNGQPEAGIAEVRLALKINPKDENALNILGGFLAKRQEYAEANVCLQKLVQLHPDEAGSHYNYGVILTVQEKWGEAAEQFTEALRIKPDLEDAKQGLETVKEHLPK